MCGSEMCVCTCMRVCLRAYVCAYIRVCMLACVCTCIRVCVQATALKAGGRGFESHLRSLFSMKIEKRALRFVVLFAFEV